MCTRREAEGICACIRISHRQLGLDRRIAGQVRARDGESLEFPGPANDPFVRTIGTSMSMQLIDTGLRVSEHGGPA